MGARTDTSSDIRYGRPWAGDKTRWESRSEEAKIQLSTVVHDRTCILDSDGGVQFTDRGLPLIKWIFVSQNHYSELYRDTFSFEHAVQAKLL